MVFDQNNSLKLISMFILSIFRLIMYRNLKENFQAIYFHKEEGLIEHTASSFLTRELRACARASYIYDVGNGIRSLARSIGRFL